MLNFFWPFFSISTLHLTVPQFLHLKNKRGELAIHLGSFQFKNYVTLQIFFLGMYVKYHIIINSLLKRTFFILLIQLLNLKCEHLFYLDIKLALALQWTVSIDIDSVPGNIFLTFSLGVSSFIHSYWKWTLLYFPWESYPLEFRIRRVTSDSSLTKLLWRV